MEGFPYLDRIEYRLYEESATIHAALENKEIDIIDNTDAQHVQYMPERDPNIVPILSDVAGTMYIAFNMQMEPLKSNKNLRKAIRYAIDPRIFGENYSPGTTPILSMAQNFPSTYREEWNWDESWYDLEKAKEYLDKAGYPLQLVVHDEVIFSVSPEDVDFVMDDVKHIMENIVKLDVPLKVEIKSGTANTSACFSAQRRQSSK